MSSQPIPVLPSVVRAYALLIANLPRVLPAALPFTLAYAVQLWLVQKGLSAPLDGFWLTLDATAMIAATVGSLAFSAMCFRLAVRDEYAGQLGLQMSGDEWRFFVVALLNAALVLIVALLAAMFAFVVFTTIAGGAVEGAGIDPEESGFDLPMAMSYMGTADWVAAWAVNAVAFILVAWLVARLAISFPASFAERRVRVLSVWTLSEGQAWRILAAMALAGLPLLGAEILLYETLCLVLDARPLLTPVMVGAEQVSDGVFARIPEYLRVAGLFSVINLPVMAGLYAGFYRARAGAAA